MDRLRDQFLRHLAALRRSDRTLEAYQIGITRFLSFMQSKGWTLETARRSARSDFAEHPSGTEGLAPASVRLYVTAASRFIVWLRQHDHPGKEAVAPALPKLRQHVPW